MHIIFIFKLFIFIYIAFAHIFRSYLWSFFGFYLYASSFCSIINLVFAFIIKLIYYLLFILYPQIYILYLRN